MKKTYNVPALHGINVELEGQLLVDSGTGMTVNKDKEVTENFAKEEGPTAGGRPRYDVWDDDWREGEGE